MGDRYLTDLADVCRVAGLNVVEHPGWQTRARSSGGYADGRPWCVMLHHTASRADPQVDVDYLATGADAAPLSNLYLDRDGTVWVIAAGATNTNGAGGPHAVSRGTVPGDQMNTHAIGVEMANSGVGEPWPAHQIDAMFRLCDALTWGYSLAVTDVCVHSVWSPGRKIDPATASAVQGPWLPDETNTSGSWDLADVLDELGARRNPTPTPPPPPSGDDMEPVLIQSPTTIAVLYGSGKVVALDGESLAGWVARYGDPVYVSAGVFAEFAARGG